MIIMITATTPTISEKMLITVVMMLFTESEAEAVDPAQVCWLVDRFAPVQRLSVMFGVVDCA